MVIDIVIDCTPAASTPVDTNEGRITKHARFDENNYTTSPSRQPSATGPAVSPVYPCVDHRMSRTTRFYVFSFLFKRVAVRPQRSAADCPGAAAVAEQCRDPIFRFRRDANWTRLQWNRRVDRKRPKNGENVTINGRLARKCLGEAENLN